MKKADVETIYTSSDINAVKTLFEEYEVSYIFCTLEKYKVNENL